MNLKYLSIFAVLAIGATGLVARADKCLNLGKIGTEAKSTGAKFSFYDVRLGKESPTDNPVNLEQVERAQLVEFLKVFKEDFLEVFTDVAAAQKSCGTFALDANTYVVKKATKQRFKVLSEEGHSGIDVSVESPTRIRFKFFSGYPDFEVTLKVDGFLSWGPEAKTFSSPSRHFKRKYPELLN